MLVPEGSHWWTCVHFYGMFVSGKNCLPFAPWEPDMVPVPRRSLGPGLWSLPDAAAVWKGTTGECGSLTAALIDRGQDEVGNRISWLWSLFFSFFFSYALTLPLLSSAAVSPDACVLHTQWDSVEFSRSRQCYTSCLALCRTSAEQLMNSFTVTGYI